MYNILKYSYIVKIIYLITTLFIFFATINYYIGNNYLFILFTFSISLLFLSSFSKNEIKFLQFFLSIFLWLGFYFKLYVCLVILNKFPEGVGSFNFTSNSYNEVMLVSSLAFLGFYLGFYLSPQKKISQINFKYLEKTYYKFDKIILSFFVLILVSVTVFNFKFSFFQKGFESNYFLNGIVRNLIAYLFLIGFGIATSLIINFEIKRKNFKYIYIALFQTFCISMSTLSRAMIIDLFAYLIGFVSKFKSYRFKKKYLVSIFCFLLIAIILFLASIKFTGAVRNLKNIHLNNDKNKIQKEISTKYYKYLNNEKSKNIYNFYEHIKEKIINIIKGDYTHLNVLITNRFVGIEGVMAVQGYEKKNFTLFIRSLKEKYKEKSLSFYDKIFLEKTSSYYESLNKIINQHAITLPGFVAFSYYAGYKFFVLVLCFITAMFLNYIIITIQNIFNNPILTAFISNILAYRLIHWGFAPSNSYKLFLSIFLSLILLIMINYALKKFIFK